MPRGTTPRGRDTQRRIADALTELARDGEPAPTARAIAARAGVSLRLVFHHFESLEDIYRLAVVRLTVEHVDPLRPVDASRPVGDRVEQTVQQWTRAYEAVSPMRRAAVALTSSMPTLPGALALTDAALAAHVRVTFRPELLSGPAGAARATGAGPAPRELLFQVLDAALSFESWDRLRRVQGLSAGRARRAMTYVVTSVLRERARTG